MHIRAFAVAGCAALEIPLLPGAHVGGAIGVTRDISRVTREQRITRSGNGGPGNYCTLQVGS